MVYISRKLSPAETRCAAVEKEALAIKWVVLELKYYLWGRRFTLITDHAPLQWMAKAKDTNAGVTRWFLALKDFHFQVQHRAGAKHGNADGLSRSWSGWAGLTGIVFPPPVLSPQLVALFPIGPVRRLWGGNVATIPRADQRRPRNTTPALIANYEQLVCNGFKAGRKTTPNGVTCSLEERLMCVFSSSSHSLTELMAILYLFTEDHRHYHH